MGFVFIHWAVLITGFLQVLIVYYNSLTSVQPWQAPRKDASTGTNVTKRIQPTRSASYTPQTSKALPLRLTRLVSGPPWMAWRDISPLYIYIYVDIDIYALFSQHLLHILHLYVKNNHLQIWIMSNSGNISLVFWINNANSLQSQCDLQLLSAKFTGSGCLDDFRVQPKISLRHCNSIQPAMVDSRTSAVPRSYLRVPWRSRLAGRLQRNRNCTVCCPWQPSANRQTS